MKRLGREHTVPIAQRNRTFDPVLTIDPGETIVVETINHMTPVVRGEEDLHAHGSPEYREREETGPIAVRGARSGDSLAVHIEEIKVVGVPHAQGAGPLFGELPQRPDLFPEEDGFCRLPGGIKVPVGLMVGDIYNVPAESTPAFDHGGNMDFTGVSPGNTLYLPVYHEGGLLVLGDVHAFQGDGEVYGEAGECAADVTIAVDIDRTYRHPRPLVEAGDRLIGLGCRGSLFESIRLVTRDMTDLFTRLYSLTRQQAYVYCTMVGSVVMAGCVARRDWTENRCIVGLSVPGPSL